MEKIFVVKSVAEKLWATEEAIDGAMASASALMGGLIEARQELNYSPVLTDVATTKIAAAMQAMAAARTAMIEAHHALVETKLRIGVRTKMDGGHKPIPNVETDEMAERRSA